MYWNRKYLIYKKSKLIHISFELDVEFVDIFVFYNTYHIHFNASIAWPLCIASLAHALKCALTGP